ncbi:MAG TPA: DoxX family protein [Asticcacaulis sp.]|nr:DoxX family protein [Asticcacaulis sp.]
MTQTQRYLPFFGRLLIAVIFVLSGIMKVTAPGDTVNEIAAAGIPLAPVAYVIAILIELVGGLLLIVGYQTRWTALVVAVYCVVAALFFHNNFADQNQMINFLKNLAMTGGLLQIVSFGAGSFSLDARFGRDRQTETMRHA